MSAQSGRPQAPGRWTASDVGLCHSGLWGGRGQHSPGQDGVGLRTASSGKDASRHPAAGAGGPGLGRPPCVRALALLSLCSVAALDFRGPLQRVPASALARHLPALCGLALSGLDLELVVLSLPCPRDGNEQLPSGAAGPGRASSLCHLLVCGPGQGAWSAATPASLWVKSDSVPPKRRAGEGPNPLVRMRGAGLQ